LPPPSFYKNTKNQHPRLSAVVSQARVSMVRIYYHDNLDTDQRLPHEGAPVTVADLEALGASVTHIPEQADVDRISKEKGYKNRDEVQFPA